MTNLYMPSHEPPPLFLTSGSIFNPCVFAKEIRQREKLSLICQSLRRDGGEMVKLRFLIDSNPFLFHTGFDGLVGRVRNFGVFDRCIWARPITVVSVHFRHVRMFNASIRFNRFDKSRFLCCSTQRIHVLSVGFSHVSKLIYGNLMKYLNYSVSDNHMTS